MRFRRWLTIVGIAVTTVGVLIGWFYGYESIEGSAHLTVPAGAGTYASYKIDDVDGWTLSGEFSTGTHSPVEFMVLDSDQYAVFLTNSSSYDTEYRTIASSGEFLVDRASMVVCYMVVRHGAGLTIPQEVSVSYSIDAIDSAGMVSSLALAFAGGLLIVYDSRKRSKRREKVISESKPLDVVFFDSESP